jgi:hypothetical protein
VLGAGRVDAGLCHDVAVGEKAMTQTGVGHPTKVDLAAASWPGKVWRTIPHRMSMVVRGRGAHW